MSEPAGSLPYSVGARAASRNGPNRRSSPRCWQSTLIPPALSGRRIGEQTDFTCKRSVSEETRLQEWTSRPICFVSRETDFRGAEIARRRRDESAETGPSRTSAGRCYVVDGAKRPRRADGAASFRRGIPPPLEAAAAASRGRDRSQTRRSGCRKRRTWRRGDGRHVAGRESVSAFVTPLTVPLRRVTRGPKHPTVHRPLWGARRLRRLRRNSRPAASGAPAAVRIDRGNSRRYLRRDDRRPSNDSGAGCDAQAVGGSRLRARRI